MFLPSDWHVIGGVESWLSRDGCPRWPPVCRRRQHKRGWSSWRDDDRDVWHWRRHLDDVDSIAAWTEWGTGRTVWRTDLHTWRLQLGCSQLPGNASHFTVDSLCVRANIGIHSPIFIGGAYGSQLIPVLLRSQSAFDTDRGTEVSVNNLSMFTAQRCLPTVESSLLIRSRRLCTTKCLPWEPLPPFPPIDGIWAIMFVWR